MRTKTIIALQKTPIRICSISCEFGRSYIEEIGRQWVVRLREHRRILNLGYLETSRLAQHSFEENLCVLCEEAKIFDAKKKPLYVKYKETGYIACLQNSISRPILEISPIWYHLIRNEQF
jgi:hypothetical protein